MTILEQIEEVNINKDEHSAQLANILTQCKTTFPPDDKIQNLNIQNIERIEVKIYKK